MFYTNDFGSCRSVLPMLAGPASASAVLIPPLGDDDQQRAPDIHRPATRRNDTGVADQPPEAGRLG